MNVPADVATVQLGIDAVDPGGTVIVAAGTYNELIDFGGKALTLRSSDPEDPAVVAATILSGAGLDGSVVRCVSGEGRRTVLAGLTITGGNGRSVPLQDPAGGGLHCDGSSPTITHCVFEGNQLGPWNGWVQGGGMYATGGHPLVVHCTFRGNAVLASGGPVEFPAGTGGGLAVYQGAATVIGCVFVGNRAGGGSFDGGGGVYVRSAAPGVQLINCVITGNDLASLFSSGGGILGDATVVNGIVWGNTGAEIANLPGPPAAATWSDIQGGFVGVGNIAADPRFARTPSPGADLTWGTADDDFGDLHLLPGSPAIDAGDNTAVPGSLITDLDGNPRFHDDPALADTGNGSSPLIDLGPYEHQGTSACGNTVASATAYGTGKPGASGIPVLSTLQPPVPGAVADLTITNAWPDSNPATQPFVLFVGNGPASIPFDGGAILVNPVLTRVLPLGTDSQGSLSIPLSVPADAALCGQQAWFQCMLGGDPGATGHHQSAQTNGLVWTVGGG